MEIGVAAESVVSHVITLLNEAPLNRHTTLLRKIRGRGLEIEEDAWTWLAELEDIAYKIEGVVLQRRSGKARRRKWTLWVSCFIPSISSFLNEAAANREISLITKEVCDKFRSKLRPQHPYVAHMRAALLFQAAGAVSEPLMSPRMFGREKDILLEKLVIMSNDEYEVVSIVGFGGSGKTTIAQALFNHDKVKSHFDTTIWVDVSNVFDEREVATKIIDSLGLHRSEEDSELLFQVLETCFSGKRVLVVFDDVWSEDASRWEPFKNSLRNGAPGSRILVTTRNHRVAEAACSGYEHRLGPLPKKDCWLILKSIAFSGRQYVEKELIKIGRKIANNCKGSPLVATTVGRLLFSKATVEEWQQVLDSEMWKIIGKSLYDQLFSTYKELSPELRSSFSYCAIFPQDTAINVEQLVRLWVAQGYFGWPTQEDEETMISKGINCFHELANRGFFQDLTQDFISIHRDKITSCKIQGAAHEFVKYLVRGDIALLPSGSIFLSPNKVRSAFIPPDCPVDAEFFGQLKRVRALVLSSRELDELPSEVGELSRLQYMDLSDNPIKELPETICNLHFLEFLDVHFCYLLSGLPQRIGELDRMKHLRVNNTTDELQILPQGFEKLGLIQTLDVFQVGGKFRGNVAKLSHLNHLKEVCIVVHGNVHFADAKLEEKTRMKNLEFSFAWSGRFEEVETSIQKLQPPPNLEMLKFEDYPGYKLPRWILTEPLVSKLTRLSLNSASRISSLPGLWRLSSLEFLWLYDIPNLNHLGHEFFGFPDPQQQHSKKERENRYEDDDDIDSDEDTTEASEDDEFNEGITCVQNVPYAFHSLKTWRMEHLENLKGWENMDEFEMEFDHMPLVMPSLKELIVNKCPNIKFPPRFQNLAVIDSLPKHKDSTHSYE